MRLIRYLVVIGAAALAMAFVTAGVASADTCWADNGICVNGPESATLSVPAGDSLAFHDSATGVTATCTTVGGAATVHTGGAGTVTSASSTGCSSSNTFFCPNPVTVTAVNLSWSTQISGSRDNITNSTNNVGWKVTCNNGVADTCTSSSSSAALASDGDGLGVDLTFDASTPNASCSTGGTGTARGTVEAKLANGDALAAAGTKTAICNGTSTGTGTKCPTNNTYFLYGIDINANDVINGSVATDSPHLNGNGKITFTDSNDGTQTITCNSSLTTKQNSDGTSNNGVKNISFSDCTTTITGCTFGTMGSNNTPYTSTITAVAKQSWEATMVIKSVNITYGLTCGGTGQSCTLTTSMLTGHVFNPSNPLKETKDASGALDISDSLTNGTGDGTKCLKSPTFDATYDLTDSGGGNILVNPPAA